MSPKNDAFQPILLSMMNLLLLQRPHAKLDKHNQRCNYITQTIFILHVRGCEEQPTIKYSFEVKNA